eukprot:jgi/Chrzof1/2233/Cz11g07190.t1
MGNDCAARVATGFGMGAALGASVGAMMGTYEAFRQKIPGIYKIRFVGQQTVGTGMVFGMFLAIGAFVHCGRN